MTDLRIFFFSLSVIFCIVNFFIAIQHMLNRNDDDSEDKKKEKGEAVVMQVAVCVCV